LSASIAVTLVPVLAAPALSAPAGTAASTSAAAAGQPATHCVLAAGRVAPRCYGTFPEAIAAATAGRVRTAPADPRTAVADAGFAAALEDGAAILASVVTGIEYANISYGGSTLTLTAPGRCDDSLDADWSYPSLPSGWNDRISSFRSYNNCAQQLFRSTSLTGGALTGILVSTANVGATANDQASSITAN
jgi:hypothetical protein